MVKKFVGGHNIEIDVSLDTLKFEKRQDVGIQFISWYWLVGKLKVKYLYSFYSNFVILFLALTVSNLFLLLLIPVMIYGFKNQFNWGDKLDDQETWNSKTLTRIDD